jgi:membrane-associated phospholipid phosphatase
MYEALANAHMPVADQVLPPLSRAADQAVLWGFIGGCLLLTNRPRLQRAALRGLLAISMASPMANIVGKQAFGRTRPLSDIIPDARRGRQSSSPSFPSGHTASAVAFAIAVGTDTPRQIGFGVGTLAAAVAVSRVYVGAHYPGDVLAGAACGLVAGRLARRLLPRLPYERPS